MGWKAVTPFYRERTCEPRHCLLLQARIFSRGKGLGKEGDDSSWVSGFLDALADELKRRVAAAGKSIVGDSRAALEALNHLLFGPRSAEDEPSKAFNEVRLEELETPCLLDFAHFFPVFIKAHLLLHIRHLLIIDLFLSLYSPSPMR
jgi:hypothetical protein